MADRKVSELAALASPASVDLLLIVDDPNGTPVSKKITLKDLFNNVPANTTIASVTTLQNRVLVSNGFITLQTKKAVSSNNATTVLGAGGLQGSIFWDDNFLYVATSNTQIKRVALNAFTP